MSGLSLPRFSAGGAKRKAGHAMLKESGSVKVRND